MSSTAFRIAVTCATVAISGCAADIHPTVSPQIVASQMAELWEQPTGVSTRDLLNGQWGVEYAPDANDTYTFLRKKRQGANPGMTIRDSQEREWHVKQGVEAQPEVVLSHVLSALGYHQPPVYYLPSFALMGENGPHTEAGGRFRLHESTLKDRGEWSWDQNPFVGTAPYQGLLVMLVMFNSADLKNENNSVYQVRHQHEGPEKWFVVRDLGSSLGEVGRFNPKENRPEVFERQPFINGVHDGFVRFAYHGVHRNLVQHRIRPADVWWASQLLAQLTEDQWQDAFRGAGYQPPVASRFIRRLHQKIEEGRQFSSETTP
jgi:hypothetical protein